MEIEVTITKLEIEEIEIKKEMKEILKELDKSAEEKIKEIEICKRYMESKKL